MELKHRLKYRLKYRLKHRLKRSLKHGCKTKIKQICNKIIISNLEIVSICKSFTDKYQFVNKLQGNTNVTYYSIFILLIGVTSKTATTLAVNALIERGEIEYLSLGATLGASNLLVKLVLVILNIVRESLFTSRY